MAVRDGDSPTRISRPSGPDEWVRHVPGQEEPPNHHDPDTGRQKWVWLFLFFIFYFGCLLNGNEKRWGLFQDWNRAARRCWQPSALIRTLPKSPIWCLDCLILHVTLNPNHSGTVSYHCYATGGCKLTLNCTRGGVELTLPPLDPVPNCKNRFVPQSNTETSVTRIRKRLENQRRRVRRREKASPLYLRRRRRLASGRPWESAGVFLFIFFFPQSTNEQTPTPEVALAQPSFKAISGDTKKKHRRGSWSDNHSFTVLADYTSRRYFVQAKVWLRKAPNQESEGRGLFLRRSAARKRLGSLGSPRSSPRQRPCCIISHSSQSD